MASGGNHLRHGETRGHQCRVRKSGNHCAEPLLLIVGSGRSNWRLIMRRTLCSLLMVLTIAAAASAQKDFYAKENKVGFKYPSTWTLGKPERLGMERAEKR